MPAVGSSRSLHGPTDSNLPKKSHTFSGWNRGNILRRPPCLQSHARCWFQVDLFMARLTQISPKNHTPSPVETGETSQLWRISRFFQGRNISPENRTSGDVGSLVKVPKGEVGPMVKDFYHKKKVQVLMCRIFFDSPFLLVTSFFLWATQKKHAKTIERFNNSAA